MEIKATSTFDLKTIQALTHLWMFKKADPKKRMIFWTIAYAILIVIIVLEMILFGADTVLITTFACAVLIYLLECYLYFLLPKIRYNSLAKMKDIINEYTFCEDAICVATGGAEYNGNCEIKYSLISKVMETEKYLFIFQNKSHVFVVDKSTIVGGTADDIKYKMTSAINGKYIVCNY